VPLEELPGRSALSRAELVQLVHEHALAWQDFEGTLRVPLWQFTADGRPLAGAAEVSRTFPGDAVALSEWMESPCPALNGRSTLDELRDGHADVVAVLVKGIVEW
jgi:hypothetical protein